GPAERSRAGGWPPAGGAAHCRRSCLLPEQYRNKCAAENRERGEGPNAAPRRKQPVDDTAPPQCSNGPTPYTARHAPVHTALRQIDGPYRPFALYRGAPSYMSAPDRERSPHHRWLAAPEDRRRWQRAAAGRPRLESNRARGLAPPTGRTEVSLAR